VDLDAVHSMTSKNAISYIEITSVSQYCLIWFRKNKYRLSAINDLLFDYFEA
jgi:hypothetical protein